ncbi:MAG: hypothetical protein E7257_00275 [Lachnospiraceae bacterium]|nr:hypothetical protein [Lachnospiraceae bacterium]MBQ9936244.1 hypothetical protein [Lachnospiraceae bacterium]
MDINERKTKGILTVIIIGIIFYVYSILCFLKPAEEMSESERRPLAQRPDISQEAIINGEYMKDFEEYAVDQAPGRQLLRGTKVFYQTVVMRKLDNDGMYLSNGYISKLDYPLNDKSIEYATNKFGYIYDNYLANTDASVYMSIIPDKNYYNEKILYPSYDYNELVVKMCEGMEYASYIDIMDKLTMEDYYQTDTHLRQERIVEASTHLGEEMGASLDEDFEEVQVTEDFRGVYYRQFGMPMSGEEMYYLTNSVIENCTVYDHENNRTITMYNLQALDSADPYEMYLHGSLSLVTIENPRATTDKELIIFRDSFGSSFAPILATGYAKVTLVDIRYLPANMLGNFVDFDNQDVLFLYSASVLNNSETLK